MFLTYKQDTKTNKKNLSLLLFSCDFILLRMIKVTETTFFSNL